MQAVFVSQRDSSGLGLQKPGGWGLGAGGWVSCWPPCRSLPVPAHLPWAAASGAHTGLGGICPHCFRQAVCSQAEPKPHEV